MKKALSTALGLAALFIGAFVTGVLAHALWKLFILGWNIVP